ncbi:hypothetical protein AVEN_270277-1, partial [Araneus ventricosus]
VLEFAKTSSVSVVQRYFHTKFCQEPLHRHNIVRWVKQFEARGYGLLMQEENPGGRPANTEVVETIHESFLRSSTVLRHVGIITYVST